MLGKLSWDAIPLDQPIPLVAVGVVVAGASSACSLWIVVKGWVPYLWREWITSVDHKRIGVMYCLLALVMLLRGFIDAIMMRSQQALAFHSAGLPAARALRPDLLGPRHDHDLLRGHAVRDRPDELRRAAAARRARRRLPDAELGQLLADRRRARCWSTSRWSSASSRAPAGCPIRRCRSCSYSPGVGVDYYLWSLQISGVGTLLTGHQLRHHHPEDARARHDLSAHADVLLDGAGLQPADRRRLPDPDRDLGDAAARPLPRLPFLHQRSRRQHDDVHEPHLGLGASGGLHPDPAGVRRLLRGGLDLLRQAAVRLPLDGDGDHGDLPALLHGLAAPLLHHGRRRRRQRLLRHHDA